VSGAFSARVIRELEPRVRTLVGETLDRLTDGRVRLRDRGRLQLPVQVICELLGIPPTIGARSSSGATRWSGWTIPSTPRRKPPPTSPRCSSTLTRARSPRRAGARPETTLVSHLLESRIDGERLDDAAFNAFMLVLAGRRQRDHAHLITNGLLDALRASGGARAAAADPGLLPTAIDGCFAGCRRSCTSPDGRARRHPREARVREGEQGDGLVRSANRDRGRSSPTPTASTSRDAERPTSRSASARTTAWAQRSRSSKRGSSSPSCSRVFRRSSRLGRPCGCGAPFIGIKHLPVRPGPRAR